MPDNNAYAANKKLAMLDRIDKFAKKKADDEKNKAAKAARRTASAMAAVQDPEFQERLRTMLDLANAAMKAGIPIEGFFSDGIRHKTGFITPAKPNPITACGIVMGGACGNTDLVVSPGPDGVKGRVRDSCPARINDRLVDPVTAHIERFLAEWPEFESEFMSHLDKTCPD